MQSLPWGSIDQVAHTRFAIAITKPCPISDRRGTKPIGNGERRDYHRWMIWFWIALVLHGAVGFAYAASGLMAPLWAVAALGVVWLLLAIGLIRVRPEGPRALMVPIFAAGFWLLAMFLGDRLLDWTA